MCAHDEGAHDGPAHDCPAHDGGAHDGDAHDGDAHDGDAHDGDAHDGDAHEGDDVRVAPWTLTLVPRDDDRLRRQLESRKVPLVVSGLSFPTTVLHALSRVLPHPYIRDHCLSDVFQLLERVDVRFDTLLSPAPRPPLPPSSPPPPPPPARLALRLDAVQCAARLSLNGRVLLETDNAFRPYYVQLPPLARHARAAHALRLEFTSVVQQLAKRAATHTYREWNDPCGGVSTLRVPQFLAGWDWAPRQLSHGVARPLELLRVDAPLLCDVSCVPALSCTPQLCARFSVAVQLLADARCAPLCVRALVLPRELDALLLPRERRLPRARRLPQLYRRLLLGDRSVLAGLRERACLVQVVQLSVDTTFAHAHDADSDASAHAPPPFMYDPFSALQLPGARTCRYGATVHVEQPRLWWPNGMGEQHLYQLYVAVFTEASQRDAGAHQPSYVLHDSRSFSVGLRDVSLVRDPSVPGEDALAVPHENPMLDPNAEGSEEQHKYQSFMFCVNGRSFFAKGANYIPSRMQYHQTTKEEYAQTISSACDANMNMLRVWGGGFYEQDVFYELCNEYGILLWHDFMFSCSLYPGDEPFLESCRAEAQYQVSRLRNHPCMALWCGNNELEQVPHDIVATEQTKRAYDTLFHHILPDVVGDDVGHTQYWPSSPHNPAGYEKGFNNPRAGDTHFWDVWHARKPVTSYLTHRSRFCSEFGMQSFLSEQGARACVGNHPGALNPFGPIMEAHQKNASGNFIITEYCQRLFRAPKDYASLSYQSQVNQMLCMQTGVEHFRRSWPYCAGALYWQLNDCWPCASWSSLEFGGNWKALHFGAKNFFAPLLITAVHHGEQTVGVCNLISFTKDTGLFSLYGTFDGLEAAVSVNVSWRLLNVCTNQTVKARKETFSLEQDTSRKLGTIDVRENVVSNPRDYVLRLVARSECNRYESCSTVWLCSPRLCDLTPPKLIMKHQGLQVEDGKSRALLEIGCDTFAPFVQIILNHPGKGAAEGAREFDHESYVAPVRYGLSENYFDLFPGEVKQIELIVHQETSGELLFPFLSVQSLVDSYMA